MSVPSEQGDFSSPTIPVSAVFVAADEPLLVFASAHDAEGYLEAIDVADGITPLLMGPRGSVQHNHEETVWSRVRGGDADRGVEDASRRMT